MSPRSSPEKFRHDAILFTICVAGILGQARGVVWGTCDNCSPGEGFGSLTIPDVLEDHVKPLGVPAYSGAMIGHVDRQFTLPLGVLIAYICMWLLGLSSNIMSLGGIAKGRKIGTGDEREYTKKTVARKIAREGR